MKRHPALQPLSDDHHGALVLARRLRRSSPRLTASDVASLAGETRRQLEEELEPHFRVEEEHLLSVLEAHDAANLAARTAADHARLRSLIRGAWEPATAGEIGTLLERHVRFEEREMFPKLESILGDAELERIRQVVERR
jgi:hypothetical protein